jgi:protein-tyrosine phosphatase
LAFEPGKMSMYDFHTHILPDLDDGSRSVAESLEMLRESARQGVTHLAATPHFYPDFASPDEFLAKRRISWNQLVPHLEPGMPQIRLGAEVYYYEGICRLNNILSLCIEGTNILLLEMPFAKWSPRMVDGLMELSGRWDIRVLLAHVERYFTYQPEKIWDVLRQRGVLMQANGEFFLNRRTRRAAIKLLEHGGIHVLGSDCHDMSSRKPNLGETADLITSKLGNDALAALNIRGSELFGKMD